MGMKEFQVPGDAILRSPIDPETGKMWKNPNLFQCED
jgi:hypothetical protein